MNIDECWYHKICKNKCSESCIRYNTIKSLYQHSLLPESQWICKKLSVGDDDIHAYRRLQAIQDDLSHFIAEGNNLYIYSKNTGNGKTSWAIKLMGEYFNSIWHKSGFECRALFINVPKFVYDCKRNISHPTKEFEEVIENIVTTDLVIWDDLPFQQFTGFEHQTILQYIDSRISAKKSNIFTGNANKSECIKLIGDKLTSRIFGCSEFIDFIEPDKRGINNG